MDFTAELNAQELGHIFNQLAPTKEQREIISDFLKIRNDTEIRYNTRLETLKKTLVEIPHHEEFLKNLHSIPIAKKTVDLILARYILLNPNPYVGLFIPSIFENANTIMGRRTIRADTPYFLRKPFGYAFPDTFTLDGMNFKRTN
uniref:Uncharacterized protein n=1 Tax=viral metagenome TaxID=1070528 RepID=A0A6C0L7W7_9ZZZZ